MSENNRPAGAQFHTTCWTVIANVKEGSARDRQAALETLCRRYWYPVYYFIRRKGYSHTEAQDHAQSFFEQMLERDGFGRADVERGRFRTFLLTCLERHLLQVRRHDQAQRRGGNVLHLSLDNEAIQARYDSEQKASSLPADCAFDQQWAQTVIRSVMQRLETEFRQAGKEKLFLALQPFLIEHKGTVSYADVAQSLGMGVNSVRTAIHRFRQRYARVFREEIAATVEHPDEIDAEIRELLAALDI